MGEEARCRSHTPELGATGSNDSRGRSGVDSTVFTIFTASDDPEVRVTLHLTEPPSSSYVQLRTNVAVHVKPAMLAANNRGLLLIHRVVANVCDPPLTSYEDNLFIYKSRPEPAMGRLWLLP